MDNILVRGKYPSWASERTIALWVQAWAPMASSRNGWSPLLAEKLLTLRAETTYMARRGDDVHGSARTQRTWLGAETTYMTQRRDDVHGSARTTTPSFRADERTSYP